MDLGVWKPVVALDEGHALLLEIINLVSLFITLIKLVCFSLLVPEKILVKRDTASAPVAAAAVVAQDDVMWSRAVAETGCLGSQTPCCDVIH